MNRPAIGQSEQVLVQNTAVRKTVERSLGIDLGAEYCKIVELTRQGGEITGRRLRVFDHGKKPGQALRDVLEKEFAWANLTSAAVSGRFAARVNLPRIPIKQAQLGGYRFVFGDTPATVVTIGSQGFSVLEYEGNGVTGFRENSRCSQGTGNFLRQLVERFSLTVEEAGVLCADVENPAPLSGRCPVILKTDMTHLANKGEDRARILAGLFDAVCENVLLLVKPGGASKRVVLAGGVSRSPRVRRVMADNLARRGLELVLLDEEESVCLEAFGCAVAAQDQPAQLPKIADLILPAPALSLERIPGLHNSLHRVRRLPAPPVSKVNGTTPKVVLGFDIGSTGSKLVALDAETRLVVWEGYRRTLGDPVRAAQDLLQNFTSSPSGICPILAFGATGSGREITGSLLTSCYGKDLVFVVNEIVAHATGALHYDKRVDTIFEIGGQDAKYIRLDHGRVIDCAMNEACSAGTGSFIEEQGRKFAGIQDVAALGRHALTADVGISLGQHCSVFMAEVIDEAVASGASQAEILSGLYDSIIKNYLNRVKGNRSVGSVIFCQGMPFAADALAAAVARQTGCEVIVPPNPGTVGALGIALLTLQELTLNQSTPVDPQRFLSAKIEHKDTFVCRSTTGCGGAGNHCRIERLRTFAEGKRSAFTWGGGCSLHDKATRKRKLPDRAPDPFREREDLLRHTIGRFAVDRGRPRVAVSDEFMLRGLLPFFASFLHESGFDVEWVAGADQATLKRGIQLASVPFCAPMQIFHGVVERMLQTGADYVLIPMVRSSPGLEQQPLSAVCPVVQAGPDLLAGVLRNSTSAAPKWLCPEVNFGPAGLESKQFLESCESLIRQLGLQTETGEWRRAWSAAVAVQKAFDASCLELGSKALKFCREKDVVPVIILGRTYTIYNTTLNSNVPSIVREQGAIAIPLDCYPVQASVPVFGGMYWGYGQMVMRAAHQLRRDPGIYAIYCSNYSCGPDSFTLHFAGHIMEGKPFAVIETDGHSGDAGTRTRVEAFLHCVEADRQLKSGATPNDFRKLRREGFSVADYRRAHSKETLLIPHMGAASDVVASILRGFDLRAEALPEPDTDSMQLGRRHTSGKECLPLPLTLGSILQRLNRSQRDERFIILIPSSTGPCRFGVYHLHTKMVLQNLGWGDRVRFWAPDDNDYFSDLPGGGEMLALAGFIACDVLNQARLDTRPRETQKGAADGVFKHHFAELLLQIEQSARTGAGLAKGIWEATSGRVFGIPQLLAKAGAEFKQYQSKRELPVIELTGEIYVRGVEFSNDYLIKKLEARGLSVRLAPTFEWITYCSFLRRQSSGPERLTNRISSAIEHRIEFSCWNGMGRELGWTKPASIPETLETSRPYLNPALLGEAALTIGATIAAWRKSQIDAVVNVGPLECMPSKIAESQLQLSGRREGLLSLSLAFDGSPVNSATLDNFAYEVYQRWQRKRTQPEATSPTHPLRRREQTRVGAPG